MNKKVVLGLVLLALASSADAANVGLVIEYEDGQVYTECIDIEDGADGYELLREADISFSFDNFGDMGHFVKKIDGIGTESISGAPCWESKYWSRFDMKTGSSSFSPSFSSLDGISDPYSAEDGDVMAWAYGYSNFCTFDSPSLEASPDFEQICLGGSKRIPRVIGMSIVQTDAITERLLGDAPAMEGHVGDLIYDGMPFDITLIEERNGKPIKGGSVEVFSGVPGISAPIASGFTDARGIASFTLDVGEYTVRVSANKYPHKYMDIMVVPTTTTTTVTTITTTTMKQTTTTAYVPPAHFLDKKTMTTAKPTTTTIKEEPPAVIGAAVAPVVDAKAAKPEDEGGSPKKRAQRTYGFWDWIGGLLGM